MGRVTQLKGRTGWYLEWTDGFGRRCRKRVHGSRGDARDLLRELELKADRDRLELGDGGPQKEPSLQELTDAWRSYLLTHRRPATWESYELGLREVMSWLGERENPLQQPSDISAADLTSFAAWKLASGVAPRTVNIRVGAVRALFNWADKQGYLRRNPIARWKSLDAPPRFRRRTLTAWEIAKLLQYSPPHLADIWRFVLGTGLRSGELASLEWRDINWDEPSIQVRAETSESKRSRVIPLRKDLVAVLRRQLQRRPARKAKAERLLALYRKRLREAETDEAIKLAERHLRVASRAAEAVDCVVFTNSVGGRWRKELCRRLEPCLKAAGLSTDLDVHTLRHTFGSHLIAGGWDVKTVQELMGHSSATVTLDVYAHAFEDRKRDAVQAAPIPIEDSADDARRRRVAVNGQPQVLTTTLFART